MSFECRDYQQESIDRTRERLAEGHRPIICAPTGSGKTIIAGHIAHDAMLAGQRTLFMSGRREILRQTYRTFCAISGITNVGILMAGEGPWWSYPPITVASWDTLKARWDKSDLVRVPADIVLVDECHLALSDKMSKTIMPFYENKTVIGLTATPARQSGLGLGSYFTRIIQVRWVQDLIDDGYLAPCEYWAGSHADVSRVRTKLGDFEQKGLSVAAADAKLIGDVVDNWMRLARTRHTIVFAVDIAHAQALTDKFQTAGIAAEVVHSKMLQETRSELTDQFKEQKFQVLVNVGIATYGYDAPSVNCVVLARPTKSIVLHLQMIGRAMRPKPDGDFAMILDHADNVRRLGCAEDKIRWKLNEGTEAATNTTQDERAKPGGESRMTECENCRHLFARSRACPKCGWEKPVAARDVQTVQADLVKVGKSRSQLALEGLDRCAWYRMMLGWTIEYKKKPGMAFYRYKEKFGEDPDRSWRGMAALEPDDRVHAYMMAGMIRYAKSKKSPEKRV